MIEFGQPAAFWTGLAIGLPILAHMAYRRITELHAFPSLRFITPSQIPRTGRKTPTDLPLLFLRILLFFAITLLLADPYWSTSVAPQKTSNEKELIVVVDLSPSMAGWNGLAEAQGIASEIIGEAEGRIGLLTFGKNAEDEWPLGSSTEVLLEAVSKLSHGWTRGDAQPTLERVVRLFGENTPQKKLVVISDFQKSDWQSSNLDFLAKGIEVEMIRVGTGTDKISRKNNQSIVESKVVPAGPDKLRIWSVIRNWSDEKKSNVLQLVVGGEVRAEQVIIIPALSSQQAQFIVPTSEVSQAIIRLVSDDPMSLDNERAVWLKAPPPKYFGFWDDPTTDEFTKSERNFLSTAVESAGDNGWNLWEESDDNANGLRMGLVDSKLELLMVLGMGKWFQEEELSPYLNSYLEGGGVAIITPAEIFSETASIFRETEWLRFSFIRVVGGAASVRNPFRIAALKQESKLAEVFSGKAGRDLYLTSFRKFGILKQLDKSIEVAMNDREGRPLALIRNFSSGGKLIFFPFRMNTSWSDLPLRTSFLPLLMELAAKDQLEEQALPVMEPGEQMGDGDKSFVAVKPGVYRHAGKLVEVVFPTAESVTDILSEDEVRMRTGTLPNATDLTKAQSSASMSEDRHSLWLWFAILVGSLLTVEMIWSRPQISKEFKEGISHA